PPRLLAGPEQVLLPVRRHPRVHQRERAPRPDHQRPPRREARAGVAGDPPLRARDEGLDVAERGAEILALAEPGTVEGAELVLPVALLPGEHQLLELAVRRDEEQRPPGLEADPALDAERGLADVDAAAQPVGGGEVAEAAHQLVALEPLAVKAHR